MKQEPLKQIREDGTIVYGIKREDGGDILHREDGPAYICKKVSMWFQNGERHRTDGPAIVWDDGEKSWYLFNVRYDSVSWLLKVYELNQKNS